MSETAREKPEIVLAADGDTLVACPCERVNAVRLGVGYQCPCGWAVLVSDSGGVLRLEAQARE